MKLYNVLNTTGDKPAYSASWLEALERQLGRELPRYYGGEELVGGHMSRYPGGSGIQDAEYIACISKSFNENQNSHVSIEVHADYFAEYSDVKCK